MAQKPALQPPPPAPPPVDDGPVYCDWCLDRFSDAYELGLHKTIEHYTRYGERITSTSEEPALKLSRRRG